MSITAQCHDCGKEYSFRPDRAGQVLPCKECGGRIRVPKPGRARSSQRGTSGQKRRSSAPQRKRSASKRSRRQKSWIAKQNPAVLGGGCVAIVALIFVAIFAMSGGSDSPETEIIVVNDSVSAGEQSVDSPSTSISSPRNSTNSTTGEGSSDVSVSSNNSSVIPPSVQNGNPDLPESMIDRIRSNMTGSGFQGFGDTEPKKLSAEGEETMDWVPVVDPLPESLVVEWTPQRGHRAPAREPGRVSVVYAGPGNPHVAVHSGHEEWSVHDIRTRRRIGRGAGSTFSPEYCALRRDGKYFAILGRDGLKVTDVREENILGSLPVESGFGRTWFLGVDRIAAVVRGEIRIWQLPSGDPVQTIKDDNNFGADEVQFTPGGKYAIVLDDDYRKPRLIFYETATGKITTDISLIGFQSDSIHNLYMDISADGTLLAGSNGDEKPTIGIWSLETGELIEQLTMEQSLGNRARIKTLQWFPDGNRLLINQSSIVDRSTGGLIFSFAENSRWTGPATVASDNSLIAFDQDKKTRGAAILSMESKDYLEIANAMKSGGSVNDAGLPPLTKIDRSGVIELNPAMETPGWQVKADPSTAPASPLRDQFDIPNREEPLEDVRFSGLNAGMLALYYNPRVSTNPKGSRRSDVESRVELFNLTTGRRARNLTFKFDCSLMAFAPDAKQVAMRLTKDKQRIDIWDCEDNSHVCGFRPYDSRLDELSAAVFVDDRHLLTLSKKKKLVLWELPSCRAIYEVEEAEGPGISPTGKYLAIRSKNVYALVEATTGKVVGRLTTDNNIRAASFHPDGRKFAAVTQVGGLFRTSFADLICWDMDTGEEIAHVPLHAAGNTIHWCGDHHVLIDNTLLVDVNSRLPQWTYTPRGPSFPRTVIHCVAAPDNRHWYLGIPDRIRGGDLKMFAVNMPGTGEAPLQVPNAESLLAVQPGQSVRLQLSLPPQILQSNVGSKIKTHIQQELAQNRIQVDSGASTVLQLIVEERATGSTDTYQFDTGFGGSPFGPARTRSQTTETRTTKQREVVCVTRFVQGTATLWESTRTFGNPYFITLENGEEFEKKLAAGRWSSAAGYFESVRLPKYVYRAGQGFGFGTTTLSYEGPVVSANTPVRPDPSFGYRGGQP